MSAFDPTLGRAPRVMIPVQLDALVLRQPGAGFADCRMRPPDPNGPARQELLPLPFADLPDVRPPGIYLHWALPDALTRERPAPSAQDGEPTGTSMPVIPDRWLVARIALGSTPEHRATTAWVIEASGEDPTVTPLQTWTESGTLPTPGREMTAFGHGDVGWAAYYDNVVDRLGFHDPLDDSTVGPLAYLVCGWYADPRLDPLADPTIASLSDFYARLAQLAWALPPGELEVDVLASSEPTESDAARPTRADATLASAAGGQAPLITDGSWWPRGCLFHGSVVGIGWPDVGWPAAEGGLLGIAAGGPPKPEETRVAFGSTTIDALGSLMVGFLAAAQGVSEDEVLSEDRMLEAFQVGLLGEIDHPDGRARLDAGLHASAFQAAPGGQTTDRVTQPASLAPRPQLPAPPGGAAPARVHAHAPGGRLGAGLAEVTTGGLEAVLPSPEPPAPARDGEPQDVQRALPRWFRAREPAVVVQGVKRSLKHGGDGRFTQDGTLVCRLSTFVATSLSARIPVIAVPDQRATYTAEQLLEQPFEPRGVPPDCVDLVHETVLLDPGSARCAALQTLPGLGGDATTIDELSRAFMVEQTVWWALRDPLVDPVALLAHSGLGGVLPSPIAVTPPAIAWTPRHLDWEVEVFASRGGLADWTLAELDLMPDDPASPAASPGTGMVVSGRSLLTGGAAQAAAAAGRAAIDLGSAAGSAGVIPGSGNVFVPAFARAVLERVASTRSNAGLDAATQTIAEALVAALRDMDILAGTLDGIHSALRHEPGGQPVGTADPPPPEPDPDAIGIVAGLLRPIRLRLVDGFGQIVDLLGSGPGQPADATAATKARTLTIPGRADVVALPPRFTAPARLLLRFVDADGGPPPGAPLEEVGDAARPLCGFLLPDHLDGALEVFDAKGDAVGSLRPAYEGDGRIVWEDAPGKPSRAGQQPSGMVANARLGAIADALVAWGVDDARAVRDEGALAALLRLIDSTLWSVDPFGHVGDEHLSLLVGHPVAVMRAVLRLDVDDPLLPDDMLTSPVSVRLGALTHWQDGLLGFFVGEDSAIVHATAPAAVQLAREVGPGRGYLGPVQSVPGFHADFAADLAIDASPGSPIDHPFVSTEPTVAVWPGHPVDLTLLLVPHAVVHATTGLLPRKDLGVRREWLTDPLARIAPSFRFGPVFVDPATIRMPVATELAGSWTWNHRRQASEWINEPVVNATQDALVASAAAVAEEGWLTMHALQESEEGP